MRRLVNYQKIFVAIFLMLILTACNFLKNEEEADYEIKIQGPSVVQVGSTIKLGYEVFPEDIEISINWSSNDDDIATVDSTGLVSGISEGDAIIKVLEKNHNISDTYKISVFKDAPLTDEERVENIIKNMTLQEKVGQMFVVHFWTDPASNNQTLPTHIIEDINTYKYGNFILFEYNTRTREGLVNLTTAIQNKVIETTKIPAFISIDQEGGMVVKAYNGPTFFPGNMALAATNNPNNSYLVGKAMGEELRSYGINMNFAPALDVNNNPLNPIIGVRSYSDNPETVAEFGTKMIKGLQESRVVPTAKHFPGHGDTSVDTHFGLPEIPHDLTRLHEIELYPFKKAIEADIDAIMTTHIIFSALDQQYPATLSYEVLTGLLRKQLGFNGLIITDGMSMNAISKNFGMKNAGALAVQAGVDLLTFTGNREHQNDAYFGILGAIRDGKITEERINQSVRRILLTKLKYGILASPLPNKDAANLDYRQNQELANNIAQQSITQYKGNFQKLDKSKKTLIISPPSDRYSLLPSLSGNFNSFAYLFHKSLHEQGLDSSYEIITNNISDNEITRIVNVAKNYDDVIIATNNANTSQGKLVNNLLIDHPELTAIALRNPYDINYYPNVNNYICVYEYTPVSIKSLIDYLNGKFTATGTIPVKLK